MTFGLPSWLKSIYGDLRYEVPVWYPSHDQPDHREWLVANGLGGYASSTICGAHTRRYHAALVAALKPPLDRHIILSRLDEVVTVGNTSYELSTNHWASGVVSPTGYKLIESFTILPAPTWVFSLASHYLIKQVCLPMGTNEVHIGYWWLPDSDSEDAEARLTVRFLTAFRSFHDEVRGSAEKHYPQVLAGSQSLVALDAAGRHLKLAWSDGEYQPHQQWWWHYHWPEESARGLPDQEDLCLLGQLTATLPPGGELQISASFMGGPNLPSLNSAVAGNLRRQNLVLAKAALPKAKEITLLSLACDQFLARRDLAGRQGLTVLAGYPWFADCGRDAMISMPGLTLAGRRFEEAKQILDTFLSLASHGIIPGRFSDRGGQPAFDAADTTLWWAWALHAYFRATRDLDFVRAQFPHLKEAARLIVEGTTPGISVDPQDGLLRCGDEGSEWTWMDSRVAAIPITPRHGKPVEVCALWYNFLETLRFLAEAVGEDVGPFHSLAILSHSSMQKFWNNEKQCLYDVLEPGHRASDKPVDSVRPNQIFAVSLPFRALTRLQEKAVIATVERELLTPLGLRSLSPTDPSYQGRYGCGFSRADEYHRDISYHQGTVWPWLMGAYCDALLNVSGPSPETHARIRLLLQPLLNHLVEEGCLGSISEIFDGNSPHTPRGCFAQAWSVAETARILAMVLRSA